MADSVVQGLSADPSRIPSKWNRQTVADGDWLQKKTLDRLSARDVYLASAIDNSTQDWKDAVEAEETRATNAEEALDQKIVQEISDRETDVDNEETRAKEAETVLQNAITDETTRATNEEERIEGLITQEQTRAQEAEGTLNTKIETEISNREEADRALAEDIEGLKAATDVISVFGTYAQFVNGSADLHATDKDFIKVLADENRNNVQTYYQSTVTTDTTEPATEDEEPVTTTTTSWAYVTALPPYYDTTTIDGKFNEISATVSSNYLSAKGAVSGSTNIKVVEDANDPKITIETYPDVTFTTVTSVGFSGTNISGASKNDTIDNLFGSAYSGAAASAWVSANSAHLDIQAGYGLETGEDKYGHLVIGLHQEHCDYNKYGLALGSWCTAHTINIGDASFAFGESCVVTGGQGTIAAGSNVDITGRFSVGLGDATDINGNYSYSIGEQNNLTADRQYAFGQGLSGNSFMIGRYNEVVPDAQFVIGGGTTGAYSVTSHKNLLVIKDDKVSAADFSAGNVSLSSLTNLSAFGNGITNTATFNLSAVKLSAGEGIGFKNDTDGVLSITAEGRAYTGENYVKVDNTTKKIGLSGELINSAQSGQSAYNWITTQSATLSAGSGINFNSAAQNTLGISVKYTTTNGYVTELDGIPLSAGANYSQGRCTTIDGQNKINLSSDINLDTKLVIDHYNSSDPETYATANLESYKLDFSGSRDNGGGSFTGRSATYCIDNLKIDNYSDANNLYFAELDKNKLQLSAFNNSVNTYTNITNTYYETQLVGGTGPYYMKFNGENISAGSNTSNVTAANWASIISAANGRFVSATSQEIVVNAPYQTQFVVTATIPGSLNANTYYII